MPRTLNETETESPNLVGYWRFDEGSGLISQDSSIYDNDAVLVSSPADPEWTQGCCPIIPEFLSIVTLPLFMAATLLGAAVYRRKRFT